ncbi:MAG: hypothetical protein QOK40_911 [Miltoncostaeaceae bacterium]|jgi:hypothetical protein|nr:hypothetical protein [Miltoncostaeaceae bacterium]
MLPVRIRHDAIQIGRHLRLGFQRTLRIPDDDRIYPLPPGLGRFPIFRVADYARTVPASWRRRGGVFIPMYQREALWLSLECSWWRACAAKVGVGRVNAVSGEAWDQDLHDDPQDYLVCPDQPWLDGINAGDGFVRQFAAMPLGMGYTVEGQVTGGEEHGGIQILAVEPKPGRFPDREPRPRLDRYSVMCCDMALSAPAGLEMGIAAGGRMRQEIHPDPHGLDTWDPTRTGRVYVHIVNSMAFRDITGLEPPATPVSARAYTEHGLPWFDLYDEGRGDLAPARALAGVKGVRAMDEGNGFAPQQDDAPVPVPAGQVTVIGEPGLVRDEQW